MGDVVVNIDGLVKFRKEIDKALHGTSTASRCIRSVFKQWAFVYRSFIRQRFSKYSRGGGNWKRLNPATIKARRKPKGKVKVKAIIPGTGVAILMDTGILFSALQPSFISNPGALEQNIPYGIRVGYGGPARHPKGRATIADIARFHQTGIEGRLPQREILVKPPMSVVRKMATLMVKKLQDKLREVAIPKRL